MFSYYCDYCGNPLGNRPSIAHHGRRTRVARRRPTAYPLDGSAFPRSRALRGLYSARVISRRVWNRERFHGLGISPLWRWRVYTARRRRVLNKGGPRTNGGHDGAGVGASSAAGGRDRGRGRRAWPRGRRGDRGATGRCGCRSHRRYGSRASGGRYVTLGGVDGSLQRGLARTDSLGGCDGA